MSNYILGELKIDWLQLSLIKNSFHPLSDNLSSGFGMTFLISISLMAAAFFSALSELWWDRDDAGRVAMLSPLSTSTVATLTSLSTPIGSLKFQLSCSNCFLGIFTTFTRPPPQRNCTSSVLFLFVFSSLFLVTRKSFHMLRSANLFEGKGRQKISIRRIPQSSFTLAHGLELFSAFALPSVLNKYAIK